MAPSVSVFLEHVDIVASPARAPAEVIGAVWI